MHCGQSLDFNGLHRVKEVSSATPCRLFMLLKTFSVKRHFGSLRNEFVIANEDENPGESWEMSRLEAYAKRRLASSSQAEGQALLQAEKAAIELYWAGCALKFIRDQKKAEHHGAWTEWKRECGHPDTTVNDAIRLYENAKTPDALTGMGITKAKKQFVYPAKTDCADDGGDEFCDLVPNEAPDTNDLDNRAKWEQQAAKAESEARAIGKEPDIAPSGYAITVMVFSEADNTAIQDGLSRWNPKSKPVHGSTNRNVSASVPPDDIPMLLNQLSRIFQDCPPSKIRLSIEL